MQGGQKPVTGSRVTAYVAGNGSFGSNAVALACVLSDASGKFEFGAASATACGGSLPTAFTCPSSNCPSASSQIYLIASGGNPGLKAGTDNAAIALLAAPGPYSSIGKSTLVDLTELTTVATVYAETQMMGATGSGCVDCGANPVQRFQAARDIAGKFPWFDHAVSRAQSLVDLTTSKPGVALPKPEACTGSGEPVNCEAERKLATLANGLAACSDSGATSSSACLNLFCAAGVGGDGVCPAIAGDGLPNDTLQAALAVALNPGKTSGKEIIGLSETTPPFVPVLASPPNDWILGLSFSFASLNNPYAIAVDGDGNVWVGNETTPRIEAVPQFIRRAAATAVGNVTKLSSSGALLSPVGGYTGGGLSNPQGIAIDSGGNAWVSNQATAGAGADSVVKFSSAGAPLSPAPNGYTGGGLDLPGLIAVDSHGNVWVANALPEPSSTQHGSVTKLSSGGEALSPATGYTGGGIFQPTGIAIDANDNVWVTDFYSGQGPTTKLDNNGNPLSPATGYPAGTSIGGTAVAIDAGGHVWFPGNATLIELSGSGDSISPGSGYTGGGLGATSVAVDGGGNIWTGNIAPGTGVLGSVSELDNSGFPLSPNTGYTAAGLNNTAALAIDASGNVWVTDTDASGSVVELIGAAVPVRTPLIGPPTAP